MHTERNIYAISRPDFAAYCVGWDQHDIAKFWDDFCNGQNQSIYEYLKEVE